MTRHLLLTCALLAVGAAGSLAQDPLRADAASMQKKVAAMTLRANKPASSKTVAPLRTSFTDNEVNAYFKVHGKELVPDGVLDPQIVIVDVGRVRARAIVDLDAALKSKERSWLDPLAWLSGKVEIIAAGTLRAVNGKGVFGLESATLGGVAIPKSLLQELVSYYSKTPDHPRGFDLDSPFDLPASIQAIETKRGGATIIQ
ncbi:MAG: hypothetical protein ABIW19_12075 [Vicinamibacterales bacterium]